MGALAEGDLVGIRDARLKQIIHDIAEGARRRWTPRSREYYYTWNRNIVSVRPGTLRVI